jgi:hypothetical protein
LGLFSSQVRNSCSISVAVVGMAAMGTETVAAC